jgi:hypothetical protein
VHACAERRAARSAVVVGVRAGAIIIARRLGRTYGGRRQAKFPRW